MAGLVRTVPFNERAFYGPAIVGYVADVYQTPLWKRFARMRFRPAFIPPPLSVNVS